MPIRPQVDIDEELNQSAFSTALAEKEEEELKVEEDKKVPTVDFEEEEIEIIEGDPELEKEKEKPDKVDTESNMLGKLVDLLSEKKSPEPVKEIKQRAVVAPIDREELRKKYNEKLHETDDPFSLLEESAQALVGGATASLSSEVQKLKKEVLKNDPINKMVFDNWNDEIENAISDLPANQQNHPDAYNYALKQVRDSHFLEILEAKVDERLSAKTRPGKTATLGSTTAKPGKKPPKKVYASLRDKSEAKRYGLSLENYLRSRDKI